MKFRTHHSAIVIIALFAVATILPLPSSTAQAGKRPEPSDYPLADHFYLDFKSRLPKRIVVEVPGQKVPVAFWYLPFTVTNNTGKEQDFLPIFEMVTQDGKIHRGDKNIPLAVFNAIQKAENGALLLPFGRLVGVIHPGEDQAKDGVAIWQEPMVRMGSFSVYISGLSSEFVQVKDDQGKPILEPQDGSPITLRKTLELNYVIWGDEIRAGLDEVQKKKERWLMR